MTYTFSVSGLRRSNREQYSNNLLVTFRDWGSIESMTEQSGIVKATLVPNHLFKFPLPEKLNDNKTWITYENYCVKCIVGGHNETNREFHPLPYKLQDRYSPPSSYQNRSNNSYYNRPTPYGRPSNY